MLGGGRRLVPEVGLMYRLRRDMYSSGPDGADRATAPDVSTVVPRRIVPTVIWTPRRIVPGFSGTPPRESNGKIEEKDQT